jgi:hypothetical protein
VEKMAHDLAYSGYMRYSPDGTSSPDLNGNTFLIGTSGYFTFAAFGCAFLLKVCFSFNQLEHGPVSDNLSVF